MGCRDYYTDNLAQLEVIESRLLGAPSFGVALLADIHGDMNDTEKAVARINQRDDVAFVVILGDITDYGLAQEYEWACKAIAKLDVPRFYVIGNHDSISLGRDIFTENFAPYDYALSFDGVKFIFYNDNAYEFADVPDLGHVSKNALSQVDGPQRLTLALSHSPPIADVHTEEDAARLRQFFYEHNINHTFHGHLHAFDYWLDEFGGGHHITSRVRDGKYAMLFVSQDNQVRIENCSEGCVVAQPRLD